MTKKDWFIVQNSIVDRDDLNVYEKMCCVVLARYADKEEFDDLLTSDIIAIKMGVDSIVAKKAVFGLIEKGLINFEGKTKQEQEEEIYQEEVKINSILNEANNDKIIKSEDSNKKITMSEFKRRLNAINSVNAPKGKDDNDIYSEPNRNIKKSKDLDQNQSEEFSFANLNFEDMFEEEDQSKAKIDDDILVDNESSQKKYKEYDLDNEFEKTLINDEWVSELEKVKDVITNSNLSEKDLYAGLSEEAKYHLGMLDNQKNNEDTNSKMENKSIKKEVKKAPLKDKNEYNNLIDQVYEVLDEQINEREARIILSFADNNIEKIKEKYKIAKLSQINDKIEVLINELQKKEIKASAITQISKEDMENLPQTQINMANINKMKMYSKYSKK